MPVFVVQRYSQRREMIAGAQRARALQVVKNDMRKRAMPVHTTGLYTRRRSLALQSVKHGLRNGQGCNIRVVQNGRSSVPKRKTSVHKHIVRSRWARQSVPKGWRKGHGDGAPSVDTTSEVQTKSLQDAGLLRRLSGAGRWTGCNPLMCRPSPNSRRKARVGHSQNLKKGRHSEIEAGRGSAPPRGGGANNNNPGLTGV